MNPRPLLTAFIALLERAKDAERRVAGAMRIGSETTHSDGDSYRNFAEGSAAVIIAAVIVIGISGIIVVAVPRIVIVVAIVAGIGIRLAIAKAAAVPASVICAVGAVAVATRQQRESHSGSEYSWNPFHFVNSG